MILFRETIMGIGNLVVLFQYTYNKVGTVTWDDFDQGQ